MKEVNLKELSNDAWQKFVESRKECVKNVRNEDNERNIYAQINKMMANYAESIKFAENQYKKNKDGTYTSLFINSMNFETPTAAKLYDVLIEFFGGNNFDREMWTIIGMVESYTKENNQ